jgi:hypothetical protein
MAAAPARPASGNQCERIRKLISRWHSDELGAERKAARLEKRPHRFSILSAKYAVHASLKSVDASRESHDTPPSRLEASRALLGLAADARFISALLLRVIHLFDLPAIRAQVSFPWPSLPSLAAASNSSSGISATRRR